MPKKSWLPVILCMLLAACIRLRIDSAYSYLVMGADGPYFPLEVRSMMDHFRLAFPDMPFLFLIGAIVAKVLLWLHVATPNTCVLMAVRVTDAVLPPLAAIPVFLISGELKSDTVKAGWLDYLMVFFSLFNYTAVVVFSYQLQKNDFSITWIFFYCYFLLRVLKYGLRRDVYYALGSLLLCALTHFGSFSILLLFTVLVGLFMSNRKKMALFFAGALALLGIIALFDPTRFYRLLVSPLKLFDGPVLLYALSGQQSVLNGFTLINVVVVNVLALLALAVLVIHRKEIARPFKVMGFSLVVLSFILASPLLGWEWANRFYLMSYVPLTLLYLIFFNTVRSAWLKVLPVCIFISFMLLSLIQVFSMGGKASITREAFSEFEQISRQVPLSERSALMGRQDLRLLGNWVFRTKGIADYLLTKEDFGKYDAIYVVKQIKGSNLPSARFRETNVPPDATGVFCGEYFELYRLKDARGWNVTKPMRSIRGIIERIDGNDIYVKNSASGITSRIEKTPKTLVQGSKLMEGMYITAWGESEPFSLALSAETIQEEHGF